MTLRKPSFGRKLRSKKPSSITDEVKTSSVKTVEANAITPPREHEKLHALGDTKATTPCDDTDRDTDRDTDISQDSPNGIRADDDHLRDSECCSRQSRCGFPDAIHDSLIFVGKKLYDCLGDPNEDTRDYMVGVSELGEEGVSVEDATFCCSGLCVREQPQGEKSGRRKSKKKVKEEVVWESKVDVGSSVA